MQALTADAFFLFLFLPSTFFFSPSIGADTLTPRQPLADGETLVSANGSFALGFFSPVDSVNRYVGIWYNKIPNQTVVWVANRRNPISDPTSSLSVTAAGNLVITNKNSSIIWSSRSSGLTSAVAQILENGNFVVRESTNNINDPTSLVTAWQSFDHPTDTSLPGMRIGGNLTSGVNYDYTAWTSPSDPSPSKYVTALDLHGDPQLILWSGSSRIWRSGPWNGLRFSGIPEMETYSMFTFDFIKEKDSAYYTFNVRDPSVISRLVTSSTGISQRLIWLEERQSWYVFWSAPKDPCDSFSPCGPFGICDVNNSPLCRCMQGFEPKSPSNWALRDGSDGCVRKTKLDCTNGTDGFVTVSGVKLPDTSSSTVDMSLNLDQCRAMCLKNCSCTAYATANISGSGSGCIMWTSNLSDVRDYSSNGQDLYLRLAAADLGSPSNTRKRGIAASITVGSIVGILLLSLLGYCAWKRENKKNKERRKKGIISQFSNIERNWEEKDFELPSYDLSTIEAATNNFSIENKLGEGGFGPVFKGRLDEGEDIAVKRLSKTSVQGADELKNEVMLIAKLQHRNLVRLLGYCIEAEERMLIYEYMSNKSLDALLFDKSKSTSLLNWRTRCNIILGIARGLLYLHQDSRFRIIHRDLKASNILLDNNMNPKISDFGMARIFGGDETEANTRRVVGTYGYMSPEYAMDGIFSMKSDVFSFGVLVLEIISGKKNRGVYTSNPHENLLGLAWSLWEEGNALQLVDESMNCSYPLSEASKCIQIGLLCVQERPEDRPIMSSVVLMLGSETCHLPHPKQPGFVAIRGPPDSSSSKQDSVPVNEISITILEGR
ncbi:receptor-like serine/threonine-protein kinase SD1-8 [Typha angustifolia]|uniref:receptor-like serine/threonine-protein kinase SD1-8 n=1 Tax=Typha angustifolia TaxID=59011 RepID=UPI003C2BE5F3